jgi:hypoxanthine phosphoribosyltransferase
MSAGARLGGRQLRRVLFTEAEIHARVDALGREISDAYGPDDDLLVLSLLKGSFIFVADLVRRIECPLQIDFLVVSSYGSEQVSSGQVRLLYDTRMDLAGRSVLLVEDIVDSGTTIRRLIPLLEEREPKSIELCALLMKPHARLDLEPRWLGFEAPDEFLVGYGLDMAEDLRHLPYIASL